MGSLETAYLQSAEEKRLRRINSRWILDWESTKIVLFADSRFFWYFYHTDFSGNVSFANVISRYFLESTVLPLVKLFNFQVLELGTSYASQGKNFNASR